MTAPGLGIENDEDRRVRRAIDERKLRVRGCRITGEYSLEKHPQHSHSFIRKFTVPQ